MSDSRSCAQGPDGELLDASNITWYYDRDDTEPLPSTLPASPSSSSQLTTSATLDNFFATVPPAQKVAGVRRTTRISRPSARVTNPDNALAPSRSSRKRHASIEALAHRRARKVVPASDEDTADNDSTKEGDEGVNDSSMVSADGETEDGRDKNSEDTDGYQYTKSLGDADCAVSLLTHNLLFKTQN